MAGVWIDINLDAVVFNYQEVLKRLSPGARCMAVVKADAYGLGAVEVARNLERAGCEAFAVTTAEEGLTLRRHGIKGLILVLGPTSAEDWHSLIEEDLQLTVSESSSLLELDKACSELNKEVEVHIKLETGMGRTGFRLDELDELYSRLSQTSRIKVSGVYTHFARAAQRDRQYTQEQYNRFLTGVAELERLGINPFWKHVCNSAAFLDYPEWHHDFVRIGTLLIGHYPGQGFSEKISLKEPWTAQSKIVFIHKVPKGTFVGYQSTYKTKRETQLAVIPVGYSDGFGVEPHLIPQGFWDLIKIIVKNVAAFFGIYLGRERVELAGKVVPVAGKIGMQLTVLDIGLIQCKPGDVVTIPLRRTLASPRILRQYWKEGRIFSIRANQEGVFLSEKNT